MRAEAFAPNTADSESRRARRFKRRRPEVAQTQRLVLIKSKCWRITLTLRKVRPVSFRHAYQGQPDGEISGENFAQAAINWLVLGRV